MQGHIDHWFRFASYELVNVLPAEPVNKKSARGAKAAV